MSIGENVGDVDTGTQPDLLEGGLTAEEQAQWDQMQQGGQSERREPEPDGGEGDEGNESDTDGDDDHEDGDGGGGEGREAPQQQRDGTDGQNANGEGKKQPRVVGFGRYKRESEAAAKRIEALTKERDEERAQRHRLDERTRLLMEAINTKQPPQQQAEPQQQEPADPEPDIEQDPFGHAAWTRRELGRTQEIIKQIQTGQQTRDQQTQASNEEQQVYRTFTADLERAAQADPSYADAFVHMRESRFTELGFIFGGIDINDPEQCAQLSPQDQAALSNKIQQAFYADQMEVARSAIKAGQSPARAMFNLAKARGFAPKAAAQQQADPPPRPNGKAPANGNGARAPSVTEQLASVRDGQAASKSLSDAGGSPGGTLTMERLTSMSDDEFNDLYDSMSKGKFDRLIGKPD